MLVDILDHGKFGHNCLIGLMRFFFTFCRKIKHSACVINNSVRADFFCCPTSIVNLTMAMGRSCLF